MFRGKDHDKNNGYRITPIGKDYSFCPHLSNLLNRFQWVDYSPLRPLITGPWDRKVVLWSDEVR